MPATVSHKFRIHNAQQFAEGFSEASNTVMYLYIGGTSPFGSSNDGGSDPNPPTPTTSTANVEYLPWNDMIAAKRATAADVSLAIPRYNWTSGTTYKMYDDADTNLIESDDFYVMTDEYNVYKCLRNSANGVTAVPSTVKPTGVSTDTFGTADNYVWKFMYKVTTSDALKFLTNDYIPVKLLTSDDGSDQWDVQTAAVAEDGGIYIIKVTNGGTGYTDGATQNIVTISGDGSGATATANVTSGIIRSVTILTKGTGYNNATVTFSGGGSGGAATAVISPKGGHGADPVEELGGKYAMVNVRLDATEGGTISTKNDFRKVGLIRDPFTFGTTTRALATNYRQTFRYTVSSTTNINVDDTMTVGSNTAKVVEVDATNNYIFTTKPYPRNFLNTAFTAGIGSGTITANNTPGLQPYSGDVLYTEYRSPISRAEDQIEDIKLIVEF